MSRLKIDKRAKIKEQRQKTKEQRIKARTNFVKSSRLLTQYETPGKLRLINAKKLKIIDFVQIEN